jgi:hypothetical protein
MSEIKHLGDERIYRLLSTASADKDNGGSSKINQNFVLIKPYLSRQTFVGDFHETPASLLRHAQDVIDSIESADAVSDKQKLIDDVVARQSARYQHINDVLNDRSLQADYAAPAAMMHPYALLRLAGVKRLSGVDSFGEYSQINLSGSNIIDSAKYNRWYETLPSFSKDPNNSDDAGVASGTAPSFGKYSKNPTTVDIINWSQHDIRGRFPYAFQDFVFCKYWNKIQNNRMITLRRYPAPTTDNVEPENYKDAPDTGQNFSGKGIPKNYTEAKKNNKSYEPFAPLATAVTFFGEGTGNSLKDLMNFAVGYNWEEMTTDVWDVTSNQIEEGQVFNNTAAGAYLNGGMQVIAQTLGIIRDLKGEGVIDTASAVGLPPDPYENGPYENRVIGPVNCINNVYKRKRGLVFNHDSLTIKFDYMSRPIAHVNNKAILLDCLSNILALTSSSGAWFGGAHKYRNERPAIYPWRNQSALNKIYSGRLFGKNGAFNDVFTSVFNKNNEAWFSNFAKGILDGIKAIANDIVASISGKAAGKEGQKSETASDRNGKAMLGKAIDTVGRAVAAHMLKGQSAPWLTGAKALLNGDPVGDWHLTIGNPLNPIAMIGNLIVEDCTIEFSDELGPDDFPLGFTATIQLKHGMGRDRDAVESMFNRGIGRIYVLSDAFKSSADYETTVDAATGKNNPLKDKIKVKNYGKMVTSGSFGIINSSMKARTALSKDDNSNIYEKTAPYNPASISAFSGEDGETILNLYRTTPWAMHQIL